MYEGEPRPVTSQYSPPGSGSVPSEWKWRTNLLLHSAATHSFIGRDLSLRSSDHGELLITEEPQDERLAFPGASGGSFFGIDISNTNRENARIQCDTNLSLCWLTLTYARSLSSQELTWDGDERRLSNSIEDCFADTLFLTGIKNPQERAQQDGFLSEDIDFYGRCLTSQFGLQNGDLTCQDQHFGECPCDTMESLPRSHKDSKGLITGKRTLVTPSLPTNSNY
jgi:hypothetical protein